jgi:predicted glycosyltransferase
MINKYHPCLIVLDEYFFLTDYCRLRKIPVVFICDFLGIPQCSIWRNPIRSLLERVFDWSIVNWQARRTERWIFTGDIDQVPREDWRTRARKLGIVMVEPITKLQYTPLPERAKARQDLGFNDNEKVVTVAVGCAGVGEYLLNAANEAASLLSDRVADLRIELLCGKGIDSTGLRRIAGPGVRVHDYVRNFQEFIAASDAAVIQSGFTTTIEYIMAGVPIAAVPLANHWEQANTARYVAQKFGVKTIDALGVSAEVLAEAMFELLSQPHQQKSPFRGDGHILAARTIADVLKSTSPAGI